jgi:glycosyltransferase involved in cell wall biosynthesis
MNNPRVLVYILTHNRPKYIKEVVNSVLNQDYNNFEVIVSDNSDDDITGKIVNEIKHPKLKYIKRNPFSADEHFNTVSREVDGDFFVWFHDDDIMIPGYLSETVSVLKKFPDLKAIGTNCFYIYEDDYSKDTGFQNNEDVIIFDKSEDLVKNYLTHAPIAPFPSYIYDTLFMKKNIFPLKKPAGVHSDVSLLMAVCDKGKLAWLNKPLVYSRLHKEQYTQGFLASVINSLNLLRYVYKKTSITRRSPEAMEFRNAGWCSWLKYSWKEALKKHPKRYFKIFRIMLPYLLKNKQKQLFGWIARKK